MSKPGPKLCCMLPQGPVLTPGVRYETFAEPSPSGVSYGAELGLTLREPIVPLLPFGLTYELDLIFMTKHPEWNMHEYALVRSSGGLLWLAKDAREGSLEQTIIAGVDDIDDWMPEVPVQRRHQPVEVVEAIGPEQVELSFAYTNWDGEPTEVWYRGKFPNTERPKRNGSTMGHSAGQLLAVLDLSHQDLGKGRVTIGGQVCKPARIFGLPVTAALRQTQGGLVTGSWTLRDGVDGMVSGIRARSGRVLDRTWRRVERDGGIELVQDDAERRLGARYQRSGDALELVQLWSWQHGQSAPGCLVSFAPALPDLRRPFGGDVESRFVIDVAGQRSHAVGRVTARWTQDGPELELRPEEPWWVWDRPMRARIRPATPGDGPDGDAVSGVSVEVERIPVVGSPPSHARCIR